MVWWAWEPWMHPPSWNKLQFDDKPAWRVKHTSMAFVTVAPEHG
jgi:hypothetical protein